MSLKRKHKTIANQNPVYNYEIVDLTTNDDNKYNKPGIVSISDSEPETGTKCSCEIKANPIKKDNSKIHTLKNLTKKTKKIKSVVIDNKELIEAHRQRRLSKKETLSYVININTKIKNGKAKLSCSKESKAGAGIQHCKCCNCLKKKFTKQTSVLKTKRDKTKGHIKTVLIDSKAIKNFEKPIPLCLRGCTGSKFATEKSATKLVTVDESVSDFKQKVNSSYKRRPVEGSTYKSLATSSGEPITSKISICSSDDESCHKIKSSKLSKSPTRNVTLENRPSRRFETPTRSRKTPIRSKTTRRSRTPKLNRKKTRKSSETTQRTVSIKETSPEKEIMRKVYLMDRYRNMMPAVTVTGCKVDVEKETRPKKSKKSSTRRKKKCSKRCDSDLSDILSDEYFDDIGTSKQKPTRQSLSKMSTDTSPYALEDVSSASDLSRPNSSATTLVLSPKIGYQLEDNVSSSSNPKSQQDVDIKLFEVAANIKTSNNELQNSEINANHLLLNAISDAECGPTESYVISDLEINPSLEMNSCEYTSFYTNSNDTTDLNIEVNGFNENYVESVQNQRISVINNETVSNMSGLNNILNAGNPIPVLIRGRPERETFLMPDSMHSDQYHINETFKPMDTEWKINPGIVEKIVDPVIPESFIKSIKKESYTLSTESKGPNLIKSEKEDTENSSLVTAQEDVLVNNQYKNTTGMSTSETNAIISQITIKTEPVDEEEDNEILRNVNNNTVIIKREIIENDVNKENRSLNYNLNDAISRDSFNVNFYQKEDKGLPVSVNNHLEAKPNTASVKIKHEY